MISSDDEMTDSPPTTNFRRHDWSHDQLPYFGDRKGHKMNQSPSFTSKPQTITNMPSRFQQYSQTKVSLLESLVAITLSCKNPDFWV